MISTGNPLFAWKALAEHLERDDRLQQEVKRLISATLANSS